MKTLTDRFGRKHDYMRIAVTDRCNLRCQYCMPEEGISCLAHEDVLSFEEIHKIVQVAAELGVRKIRLTGGEPLARKDLEQLVALISSVPGIEDIAMTTNAILLAEKMDALMAAGLKRVNISLDSLNPEKYKEITRGGDLNKVLRAIDMAIDKGLTPVKVNAVVIKGFNDDEIEDFIRWTLDKEVEMRFIEYMPIGDSLVWKDGYFPLDTVREIGERVGKVIDMESAKSNGPAQLFKIEGAKGSVGVIHPVSQHFCASCNRLRLTADGKLKPCLFWQKEIDVKPYIQDREQLIDVFAETLNVKKEKHEMTDELLRTDRTDRKMSQIGG